MFALSLRPTPPKATTKQKLLDMVSAAMAATGQEHASSEATAVLG